MGLYAGGRGSGRHAVMAREKLTRRSAVVKRVLAKWPGGVGTIGS